MSTPVTEWNDTFNIAVGLDKTWLLVCGSMIMSMQIGFAWLEAGGIRRKNASVVYHKLTLNLLITVFTFWVIGYAFAFGESQGDRFIGAQSFYAGNSWDQAAHSQQTQYAHWLFQVCIAAVVPAITGGVVAERMTLKATAVHTFFLTLLIYPFTLSWTWGGGWMITQCDYQDFTGSGIVHCTGAFAGLACLLIVGPRYQKYGDHVDVMDHAAPAAVTEQGDHSPLTKKVVPSAFPTNALEKTPEPVHTEANGETDRGLVAAVDSVPEENRFTQANIEKMRMQVYMDGFDKIGASDMSLLLMGAMFLWFGFIFFNAGSSLMIHRQDLWLSAEKAAVNTFMAGLGGGFIALALKKNMVVGTKEPRVWKDDAATVANAYLAGMVANGAGMGGYEPWEGIVVGALGGLAYSVLCLVFEKIKLDDALEAFQLHGGAGTTGVIAAAFFNHKNGIFHGGPGKSLGYQILCWLVISAWSFIWSFIIFFILKKMGWLRIDLKTEIVGYDYMDHAGHLVFDESVKKLKRDPAKKGKAGH